MADEQPIIHHISDTARWAAYFRARENERPDAVFRDPYAQQLAGERGAEIAKTTTFQVQSSWAWVARTYVYDKFITQQIQQGADLIVNLAAGLDARPYRMSLPPSLKWVEVDHPEILDYKEQVLVGTKPGCAVERVRLDLADVNARRTLFQRLSTEGSKALVISEGLLVYLTADEAAQLAKDLAAIPSFKHWALDLMSPGLLKLIKKNSTADFISGAAPLKFAPANGPGFFTPYGWQLVEVGSMLKTAAQLRRLPELRLRFFALFPENPAKMGGRPWSGACLMKKVVSG